MFLASATAAPLRITDCRGFSTRRNSASFAGHHASVFFTTRCFIIEYTYRDCLSEEIEILQLMLYRDEFLTLDPKACKHSGPLISKIEENMKELSELNDQP